jgi:hypothetical protein
MTTPAMIAVFFQVFIASRHLLWYAATLGKSGVGYIRPARHAGGDESTRHQIRRSAPKSSPDRLVGMASPARAKVLTHCWNYNLSSPRPRKPELRAILPRATRDCWGAQAPTICLDRPT